MGCSQSFPPNKTVKHYPELLKKPIENQQDEDAPATTVRVEVTLYGIINLTLVYLFPVSCDCVLKSQSLKRIRPLDSTAVYEPAHSANERSEESTRAV